jgi:hypothetical protein
MPSDGPAPQLQRRVAQSLVPAEVLAPNTSYARDRTDKGFKEEIRQTWVISL